MSIHGQVASKSLWFIIPDSASQITSKLNDSFMRHKAANYKMSEVVPFEIMS
jgi:hypothetical protein